MLGHRHFWQIQGHQHHCDERVEVTLKILSNQSRKSGVFVISSVTSWYSLTDDSQDVLTRCRRHPWIHRLAHRGDS